MRASDIGFVGFISSAVVGGGVGSGVFALSGDGLDGVEDEWECDITAGAFAGSDGDGCEGVDKDSEANGVDAECEWRPVFPVSGLEADGGGDKSRA